MSATPAHDRLVERFDLIVNGPALFNGLVAGLELGVFRTLAQGATDFDKLRRAVGLPEHQLRVLMQVLCATELVNVQDDVYTNAPATEPMLCADGPDSWLHILRGWQRIYYPAFAQTTTALLAGTNTALASYPGHGRTLYERLAHDPTTESVLHAAMSAFTQQSMSGLLDTIDLAAGTTMLDIGGGDGTTARELVKRFPDLSVVVLDLPSVVAISQDDTTTARADRITFRGVDIFRDPFPQDMDAVLFSHCLEVLSPERVLILLRKALDALKPGGRLFIYGYTPTDEQQGVYSARLSLYLTVLATGEGMAYPVRGYRKLLLEAGFGAVTSTSDLPYEHSLIVATRE